MKNKKGLLLCFLACGWAHADAGGGAKWYDAFSLGGYLQSSYVGNLNSPSSKLNTYRVFDQESNSFNLNALHLDIVKPVGSDDFGMTARLHTGRDARNIKSVGTFGATDFDVEEAYLTYPIPLCKKLSLIGGKFIGLESAERIETIRNPTFSMGYIAGFAVPATHTGLKATYTLSEKANATVGVVNGWDTVADGNDGKTILWQTILTPVKFIYWGLQGSYGPEALSDNTSKRTSLDTVFGIFLSEKLGFMLNGDWGQDTNVTAFAPGSLVPGPLAYAPGPSTVHWSGVAAWAQYTFTKVDAEGNAAAFPAYGEALRYEVFGDQNGADRLTALNAAPTAAANQTVKNITWSHKFQWTKNLSTRLEYRHDWSNVGTFVLHEPGRTGTNQNTLSAEWVVTF